MPYVTLAGDRLYFEQRNIAPDLPTLLLIHGAGGSRLDWPVALRRLEAANVIAVDLPGHGRSSAPARQSVPDYANDLSVFVDAFTFPITAVAGHSMGAAIALTMAPHLAGLRRLILIGASARLRVGESILNAILPDFPTAVERIVGYAVPATARPSVAGRVRRQLEMCGSETVYGDFSACHHFDARGQLGDIAIPTLVIGGEVDLMTPARYGRALAGELPAAEFVELEGAGHYLMLEQPDEVARLIGKFLAP